MVSERSKGECQTDSRPTEIMLYELDIMAMRRLSRTITFITEYDPYINMAQKRVKLPTPVSSKASNSTRPNDAQKSDCDVSNRLAEEKETGSS